jgi:hypothetical protein
MPLQSGDKPVGDNEIIYRRIPLVWCDQKQGLVKIEAFKPGEQDVTGLSVSRAKYRQRAADTARNTRGKQYYIASLKVSELRKHGIDVVPRPLHSDNPEHPEHDPSHAEIPQLTYQARKSDRCMEIMHLLATVLCDSVDGPYPALNTQV